MYLISETYVKYYMYMYYVYSSFFFSKSEVSNMKGSTIIEDPDSFLM